MLEKQNVILIVGNAGSGKTFASQYLAKEWEKVGANLICSYTTRPIREGEVDGVDHIYTDLAEFVKHHSDGTIIASTNYGNHKYWTTIDQFKGISIYVVDEDGIRYLESEFPEFANIYKLYIASKNSIKEARGVSPERMQRDLDRRPLLIDEYDCVIHNNGSIGAFKLNLDAVMADAIQFFKTKN